MGAPSPTSCNELLTECRPVGREWLGLRGHGSPVNLSHSQPRPVTLTDWALSHSRPGACHTHSLGPVTLTAWGSSHSQPWACHTNGLGPSPGSVMPTAWTCHIHSCDLSHSQPGPVTFTAWACHAHSCDLSHSQPGPVSRSHIQPGFITLTAGPVTLTAWACHMV